MGKNREFDGKIWGQKINNTLEVFHSHITAINGSKIFAGLMIIVLNVASRFVTIKLSKTMESYLKHTFSRQALIFAIAWMGTRDIYISLLISIIFSLFVDLLFNENSRFCILPTTVTEYYTNLPDLDTSMPNNSPGMPNNSQQPQPARSKDKDEAITKDEMEHAKSVIYKWKMQHQEA
jgi:hypothetical protein